MHLLIFLSWKNCQMAFCGYSMLILNENQKIILKALSWQFPVRDMLMIMPFSLVYA